jgi:tetratricopeptide (TPR) repeat protein
MLTGETASPRRDASSDERVIAWCAEYAEALVAGDTAKCTALLHDALDLPPAFSAIVDGYLRRAAVVGPTDPAAAARLLSAGVTELEEPVTPVADGRAASIADDDDLRAAITHGLTAAWLDAAELGRPAAAEYYESGKYFGWLGDQHAPRSMDLLSRASALDATHVGTYWLLSNAWFARSSSDPDGLRKSLDFWNRGAALQLPDASSSWAYVLRALICDESTRTDDAHRFAYWWQGIVFIERAILLNDTDAVRWANLGRLYRMLESEAAALHATAQAYQRDPENTTVLEERAAVLANTGMSDEALKLIDVRLGKDDANIWAKGVRAYILMHQQAYAAALAQIDEVIALEPGSIWNLDVRAACCKMLGDADGARAAYERILASLSDNAVSDDVRTCAWAAFNLGQIDRAEALIEKSVLAEDDGGMRLRGLCHLSAGRVSRGEELLLCGIARSNLRELAELLTMDLPVAERSAAATPEAREAAAAVRRIRRVGEALFTELRRSGPGDITASAEMELASALDTAGDGPADDSRRIAARAGLARLHLEASRWTEAARHYRVLQASVDFPEARLGFARAVDGLRAAARQQFDQGAFEQAARDWQTLAAVLGDDAPAAESSEVQRDIGDALWKADRSDDALEQYTRSLATLPADRTADAALLNARIALAHQQLGSLTAAGAHIEAALRLFREAGRPDAGRALGETCRPLLRNADHCWEVESQWTELEQACATDTLRSTFGEARESLLEFLDTLLHLSEETNAEKTLPIVTPIALGVGSELVKLVDPAIDRKFIYEDIPAMRSRLQDDVGIHRIPGIRVHEDPATPDGYEILIDGAPMARGSVKLQRRYCALLPDGLADWGVARTTYDEVTDPITNMPAAWHAEPSWPILANHGLTLLSPTEFILRHVEHVLRGHLDLFLGVQEAEDVIGTLTRDVPAPSPAAVALANADTRLLFSRALRALVRDRVRLTDAAAIMAGAAASAWASVPDIVRHVRLHLKPQLPGNEPGTALVQVPDDWSADVSPEAAHRMLSAVREWLLPYATPVALLTRHASFRPALRRLIESEFPSVPVLADEEVIDSSRIVSPAQRDAVSGAL